MLEALVVRLVQAPVLVQPVVGPLAPVAGDAREQDEVVVPAGDLERVELERAEAVDDPQDALRLGRQRAGGREEVAQD